MHHPTKTPWRLPVQSIKLSRLISFISSSSSDSLNFQLAEDAKWSKSNEAKQTFAMLSQSSYDQRKQHPRIIADNMTSYITHRLNRVPGHHELRVLSDLLTFPLSLSMAVQAMLPGPFLEEVEELNILVVGARAESSLPLIWWQEALRLQLPQTTSSNGSHHHHHHSYTGNGNGTGTSQKQQKHYRRWKIHMIGPGLQQTIFPPQPQLQLQPQLTNTGGGGGGGGGGGVYLNSPYSPDDRHILQNHPHHLSLLRSAHLIALFHPGLGSPLFTQSWSHAVRELLVPCRKPLLLTAMNTQDMHRDLTALKQMMTIASEEDQGHEEAELLESLLKPGANPFSSLRSRPLSIDGGETSSGGQLVFSNHQICGLLPK